MAHPETAPDGWPWSRERAYIRETLDATDSTSHDLWLAYVALTGNATLEAVIEFVDDDGELAPTDVALVEHAAIERLADRGGGWPPTIEAPEPPDA